MRSGGSFRMLTVKEAAIFYDVSARTIRRWCESKTLNAQKHGNMWFIKENRRLKCTTKKH